MLRGSPSSQKSLNFFKGSPDTEQPPTLEASSHGAMFTREFFSPPILVQKGDARIRSAVPRTATSSSGSNNFASVAAFPKVASNLPYPFANRAPGLALLSSWPGSDHCESRTVVVGDPAELRNKNRGCERGRAWH